MHALSVIMEKATGRIKFMNYIKKRKEIFAGLRAMYPAFMIEKLISV